MRYALTLALATIAFAVVGCDTVDKRISEKASVFNSLPPDQQKSIREGHIQVGFSEDMAYIALGKPDEVKERITDHGKVTTWTYLSYSQQYEGEHHLGFRRQVFVDRKTNKAYVALIPMQESVYSERVEEILRVEFRDGQIVAIEEPKQR